MRSLESSRKRWDVLSSFSEGTLYEGLQAAVRDTATKPNPFEDGLRSVCWKVLLLLGPIRQDLWPKRLSDWRDTYSSLSDHFLKYIDHPNNLQTTVDPLTDDENSPWNAVRKDELDREEILQDVTRCMQDVEFFQQPSTQRILLDILFIYSKLHPDIGYRQGMHELLAPILWVAHCDTIETDRLADVERSDTLMLKLLDRRYLIHDTFTLFCAVMHPAKTFYEFEDSASRIVERSRRIHETYLSEIDPQLASHLQEIEILPQIFLIRWMRLLFLREFGFNDVLSVWDILFSQNLNLSLVDTTCIAMLLRIRWQLLEADTTEALHLLLHYEPPLPPQGPATLVHDAICLDQSRTRETGASLIAHYSGRRPSSQSEQVSLPRVRPTSLQLNQRKRVSLSQEARGTGSAGRSPSQLFSPPKGLESLFHEVSGNLQKRSEHWKVPKAVRDAVGEVRRNVNNMQSGRGSSGRGAETTVSPTSPGVKGYSSSETLMKQLATLEERNQSLSRIIGQAINDLSIQESSCDSNDVVIPNAFFYGALNKMKIVQECLADLDITISIPDPHNLASEEAAEAGRPEVTDIEQPDLVEAKGPKSAPSVTQSTHDRNHLSKTSVEESIGPQSAIQSEIYGSPSGSQSTLIDHSIGNTEVEPISSSFSPAKIRSPLARSPLSWMLGEGQRRSDFVSSLAPPPEQRRDSVPKARPKHLFPAGKDGETKLGSDSEDDGFIMSPLTGQGDRSIK